MYTNVGDVATECYEILTKLERSGNADSFNDHVTATSIRQLHDLGLDVATSIDGVISAHLLRCLETASILVNCNQNRRRQELGREQRTQALSNVSKIQNPNSSVKLPYHRTSPDDDD
jgi:hypothetical protein